MPPDPVVPPFDADNDIVYVKSTDGAGFPAIRAFAFQPIENPTPQTQRYVTREGFDDTSAKPKGAIGNGRQPVREPKHPDPGQLTGKTMGANPQFAASVNQNEGKGPGQTARGNGIDFDMARKVFK